MVIQIQLQHQIQVKYHLILKDISELKCVHDIKCWLQLHKLRIQKQKRENDKKLRSCHCKLNKDQCVIVTSNKKTGQIFIA